MLVTCINPQYSAQYARTNLPVATCYALLRDSMRDSYISGGGGAMDDGVRVMYNCISDVLWEEVFDCNNARA